MIETVIFDLDGLLIDSERSFYEMDERFLKRFGKSFTLEEYVKDYCGRTVNANIERFIVKYDLPITLGEGLLIINEEIAKETTKGIPLKKGALELLQYLKEKGYKVALATSSVKERALTLLSKNGVDSYFDDYVFGPEVKRGKPYPDVFYKAAAKVGSDPLNCLFLEDSEAGIKAASSAGMSVICIPDLKVPSDPFCKMADAILTSLFDVIDYLKMKK